MSSKTKLLSMALLGSILIAVALLLVLDPGGTPDNPEPGTGTDQTAEGLTAPDPAAAELPAGERAVAEIEELPTGERLEIEPPESGRAERISGRILFDPRVAVAGGVMLAYRGQREDKRGAFSNLMSNLAMADPSQGSPDLTMRLTGEPLARADVEPDGSFVIEGVTEPHVRLALQHDFYGLKQTEPVHMPEDQASISVGALETYLGAHVIGQVVGPGREAGLTINIAAEPDPMAPMQDVEGFMSMIFQVGELEALADASGRFEFRALWPSPSVRMIAKSEAYCGRTEVFSLAPGEKRELLLGTQPGISVRAIVIDHDEAPIERARVVASPTEIRGDTSRAVVRSTDRTDADGVATLTGLWPGTHQVEVTADGFRATGREIEVRSAGGEPEVIEFRLDQGGFVSGIVVNRDGEPVPEAKVAHVPRIDFPMLGDLTDMIGLDIYSRAAQGSPFTTDEQGAFKITGLQDDSTFHVIAVHDDYVPGLVDAQMGNDGVRIELVPGARIIGTMVAAESEEPITEFTVETLISMMMVMERPTRIETVRGAEDGMFELAGVPAGSVKLRFRAEGRAELTKRVRVESGEEVDLGVVSLEPHAVIRGQVLDAVGRPVMGATVLRKSGGLADNPILSAMTGTTSVKTDDEGNFELSGVVPGRVILLAQAKGYASGQSERLRVEAAQILEGVVIQMGTGGSIAGRLLLSPGQDITEWQIIPTQFPAGTFDGGSPRADGSFRFDNLDPGRYEVQAFNVNTMSQMQGNRDFRPGAAIDLGNIFETINDSIVRVRCTVTEGETTEIELDASELGSPGITLELGVSLGGTPMEEGWAEIRALDSTATVVGIIDGGNMKLTGLEAGTLQVQVRSGITYTPVGEPQAVEIPADVQLHRANVDLPGGEIHGRVMNDVNGEALAGTMVRLIHEGTNFNEDDLFAFALTDDEGAFQFLGLADGAYGLVAGGELTTTSAAGVSSRLRGIEVRGSDIVDGLMLRARPGAGVTVEVTDDAGAPLAGALLLAVDESGNPLVNMGLTYTGPNGRAEFGGLPAGPVRIVGRSPGLAPGVTDLREVVAGEHLELQLRLGTGPRVTLRITDREGVPLIGANLSARTGGGPWLPATLLVQGVESDGSLAIGPVPPGSWEFRVSHPAIETFVITRDIPRSERVSLILSPR